MLNRFDAEEILRAATGGSIPAEGDSLVRTNSGWQFGQAEFNWLGVVDADPAEPNNGDLWFNLTDLKIRVSAGGTVYESVAFTAI